MKTNQTIGQREQKLKVQVHGDDQSPHPGRLHGASLATAMQRPCRPLVENPLSRGGHTQIAGFGAFSKNGGAHTVPFRGAHVKNLNSHLKSLRNQRKERQKEQR